ncbi:enoyl-CoA hydratase [Saccharopolyspora sp. ID03-671]|uniref:enoyl-CoA hydratase n=1 Tax=Saccharopolyspora sp. ID03-671 TaxID=3073066 RepID=UPI0032508A9C
MSTSATPREFSVERDGGVLRISWDRPEALNALTGEMVLGTAAAIEAAADDPAVRVVVIAGRGPAFSAGADLEEVNPDQPIGEATLDAANRLIRAIRAVPKPVVAAVHGPAAGFGASIALSADITLAASSAYFLLAFAHVGLMPDGGSTALVPASIGRARATRMAMLGERVDAATAFDWGLITKATSDEDFPAELANLTAKLEAGPTAAYARIKQALDTTALSALEPALEVEKDGQLALFESHDFTEGTRAFREKRKPRFVGA